LVLASGLTQEELARIQSRRDHARADSEAGGEAPPEKQPGVPAALSLMNRDGARAPRGGRDGARGERSAEPDLGGGKYVAAHAVAVRESGGKS